MIGNMEPCSEKNDASGFPGMFPNGWKIPRETCESFLASAEVKMRFLAGRDPAEIRTHLRCLRVLGVRHGMPRHVFCFLCIPRLGYFVNGDETMPGRFRGRNVLLQASRYICHVKEREPSQSLK